MIKILFLAANPQDTTSLRLDEECRAIDQAVRVSEFRDQFDIKSHWAVRIWDLQELLLRHTPHIVHFSGHGSKTNEIILQDNFGASQPVSAKALEKLFGVLKDNIRCVVLNACYSQSQAEAIAKNIDCVVGMSKAILDTSAISFAAAFYRALGYGRDVKTAFDLGCLQIDLDNLGEEDAPQLLSPRYDPKTVKFSVSQSARTINSNQPKTVIDQRGQIVTTQYNAETQYNVQNLNVTNLTQLDAIDQTVKRNLISAYEAQIRKTPEQAKYHLALGLFYLDLRLYTRAIKWLEEAHTKDPLNPNALYYLALACVEGKPPRILKESTVELIESYLDAAIRLDSSKPHFYYLWALIKYDFYFENGYTTTPQETEELLDIANQLEPNYREIELMLSHVPIPDDSRMAETLSRKPTSSRSQKQTWSFFRR